MLVSVFSPRLYPEENTPAMVSMATKCDSLTPMVASFRWPDNLPDLPMGQFLLSLVWYMLSVLEGKTRSITTKNVYYTVYEKFADDIFQSKWAIVMQYVISKHTKKDYCIISCLNCNAISFCSKPLCIES